MTVFEEESDAVLLISLCALTFYTAQYHNDRKTSRWYDGGGKFITLNPPRWLWSLFSFVSDVFLISAMYVYVQDRFENGDAGSQTDAVVISYIVASLLRKYWHRTFFKMRTVAWAFAVQMLVFIFLLVILGIMGANGEWTAFGLMMVTVVWHFFVLVLNAYWIWATRKHPELDANYEELEAVQTGVAETIGHVGSFFSAGTHQLQQQYYYNSGNNSNNNNTSGSLVGKGPSFKPSGNGNAKNHSKGRTAR